MKARIFEGDYSPDDLARFLLRASGGNYMKAKKALTRASNEKPTRMNDSAVYLAAYAIKKRDRCSDHTALRKLLGDGRYRVFWNKLQKRGQTLKQIARLYPGGVFKGQTLKQIKRAYIIFGVKPTP